MKAKKCPECGKEPVLEQLGKPFAGQWAVICKTFECDRSWLPEPHQREAIRKWNERKKRAGSLNGRKAEIARNFYISLPDGHPAKADALNEWRKLRLRSMRKPIDTRSS